MASILTAIQSIFISAPTYKHSSICPEYADVVNAKTELMAHPDQEMISNCINWLGRLDDERKRVAWSILMTPKNLQLMLNASGSNMVLFVAAARGVLNLPFTVDNITLPYNVIRMDDLEWCKTYFEEQKEKLSNASTLLTDHDLDRLWIMFYATGDSSFTVRIKDVANGKHTAQDAAVVLVAAWSYNSHLNGNRLAQTPPISVLQMLDKV